MGQGQRLRARNDTSIEGAIMGLARNLAQRKSQETTRMTPVRTLSNSGDLLTLPSIQIDDYFKCHHRSFIQELMESEAQTHSRALC